MSVSINDDYDGSTKLSDWYPVVKENFAALAEAADSNADAAATAQETAESAATAAANAQTTADGKAPTNHRSTGETYGVGTNTYYGHVKLSDSVEDSSAAASGGVAATPYAVKLAYDKAVEAAETAETAQAAADTAQSTAEAAQEAAESAASASLISENNVKGISVGSTASAIGTGVAIGINAVTTGGGTAVGYTANAEEGGAVGGGAETDNGGAIGRNAYAENGGAAGSGAYADNGGAVGYNATANAGFAGGYNAKATGANAIQLGEGTNSTANTLQVYDYQLLDANGQIPAERLEDVYTAISNIETTGTTASVATDAEAEEMLDEILSA